jgi:hypothetical protein
MAFYTISDQKKYDTIAEAIVGREQEIFHYELNITNYEAMLAALPSDDWPQNLVQYQRATLDQVPDEHDQTVTDYQYRDRLRLLVKTERLERSKSVKVYEALLAQLPEDQRESLIAAAHTRMQNA